MWGWDKRLRKRHVKLSRLYADAGHLSRGREVTESVIVDEHAIPYALNEFHPREQVPVTWQRFKF